MSDLLLPGELDLWRRLGGADRRHAVGVARRVVASLGPDDATRPGVASALLHDVGKLASGLGVYGRVVATVCGLATRGEMAGAWSESSGITRRVGLYLRHAQLGADMLRLAGSDGLTIAWAAQHHLPAEYWTVDQRIGHALKAADDD